MNITKLTNAQARMIHNFLYYNMAPPKGSEASDKIILGDLARVPAFDETVKESYWEDRDRREVRYWERDIFAKARLMPSRVYLFDNEAVGGGMSYHLDLGDEGLSGPFIQFNRTTKMIAEMGELLLPENDDPKLRAERIKYIQAARLTHGGLKVAA
jgi:hypothetical protein